MKANDVAAADANVLLIRVLASPVEEIDSKGKGIII